MMAALPAAADAHLVAVREGEDERPELPSFRSVYDTYFNFVWSCARHLGVPADDVNDVVQEVFIVVHARLHTVERPASLRSWVYGVLRRTVSTYHRGRRSRATRGAVDLTRGNQADRSQPSPLDVALLGEEIKLVWQLLGEVEAAKREVLVLAELEEMSVPGIAQAIGIPLNTAYSRLRAGRQEFNAAFARYVARRARGRDE